MSARNLASPASIPAQVLGPIPLLIGALPLLLGACSDDGAAVPSAPAAVRRTERSNDPRAVAAREALDAGRLEQARALLTQVEGLIGVEARLLEARLAFLEREVERWARLVEQARLEAPDDPRVYATAAELYAAAGKMETADREIKRGLERCGVTAELERARGVQALYIQGGARQGLRLLESAREHDPDLPFCARALGQAHLLVAKSLAQSDPDQALEQVRRSLEFDPEEVDAREFHGDLLMMLGEWGDGIAVFEELLRDGHEKYRMQLADFCHKAGVWAMQKRERELALQYCARARELGMAEEHLGSCANMLAEEARRFVERAREAAEADDLVLADDLALRALEFEPGFAPARARLAAGEVSRGVARLAEDDLDGAVEHLAAAVEHDPNSLEAHNFLGQAHHARGEYSKAASEWSWVVECARLERIALPEPVHLRLAEALARTLDFEGARRALEAYLLFEPIGAYVEVTRQVLAKLPPPSEGAEVDKPPRSSDPQAPPGGDGDE